jgi:hypothetical protein
MRGRERWPARVTSWSILQREKEERRRKDEKWGVCPKFV